MANRKSWICSFCGKKFEWMKERNKHFGEEHPPRISPSENQVLAGGNEPWNKSGREPK